MKQKRNRHWRGPGPQPRKMFDAGSKAWARRMKGDVRRARIRALRIAERQLRPHGWRVESARKAPNIEDTMVDVRAIGPRRDGPVDVFDILGDSAAYGPLLWVGNTCSLMTRHGLRVELAIHCRGASIICHPWCECESCSAPPF